MAISLPAAPDPVPALVDDLAPPLIHGAAALAHRAFAGQKLAELLAMLARPVPTLAATAALTLDWAAAHELCFRAADAGLLQDVALNQCRLFRVESGSAAGAAPPLRLLALVAPGDAMTNTPLDFITRHLNVRLDLLYVCPGHRLPDAVPDHDVAFFAVSESAPDALRRLAPLFAAWPRPALNDPARIALLSREAVASGLAGLPGLCSPPALRADRASLAAHLSGSVPIDLLRSGPAIIRPFGSHAGRDLQLIEDDAALTAYLDCSAAPAFTLARYIDYRGADGLFRKYRIAFVDGAPFLCHMASSPHWMVHYLNAGMAENASRRQAEAAAMAAFDRGFARRHAAALAGVADWLGLDYCQIDCAEAPDGRLLVFEADVAAIVHLMDPPALFPYKPAQMRRVFAAFHAMLRDRAAAAAAAAGRPARAGRQPGQVAAATSL